MADAAPAPTNAKQAFEMMPSRFNKDAAKGLNATYQFDLSGDGGGKWQVIIKDQNIEVKEGANPSPSITISMAAQDYLDMLSGKLNGQVAFMSGKLRISGDMGLALRMQSLFNT
jgi:putative sterol carrier protein